MDNLHYLKSLVILQISQSSDSHGLHQYGITIPVLRSLLTRCYLVIFSALKIQLVIDSHSTFYQLVKSIVADLVLMFAVSSD